VSRHLVSIAVQFTTLAFCFCTQAFPASKPILDGANANFFYWKKIEERNQAAAAASTPTSAT